MSYIKHRSWLLQTAKSPLSDLIKIINIYILGLKFLCFLNNLERLSLVYSEVSELTITYYFAGKENSVLCGLCVQHLARDQEYFNNFPFQFSIEYYTSFFFF
ncbi:hypothetical protein V8G54_014149, partial [Vigna mungo]